MSRRCDLAVVGSGPGGCAAALTAARRGLRVCLIDRDSWGGVCLNVGCIPTKALVAVAHMVRRLRQAARMGIRIAGYEVDYPAVMARNHAIVTTLRQGLTDVLRRERVELVQGSAAFDGPNRLLVTEEGQAEPLEAERIVLATGARPIAGPWAFDEERLLSYRGILSLTTQPSSLLVIGGGVMGCEFASAFCGLGTRVTIVEQQPQLLPMEDPDAVRWLTRALADAGAAILTGTTVQRLEAGPHGVSATLSDGTSHTVERCLIAIGQRPNIDSLQLGAASVAASTGITVDRSLRTSQPHIAAIGDCLEGHGLAHWASAEGVCAVHSLLGESQEGPSANEVPRVAFTDPEIAHVGLTASEAGESLRVSRLSFGALGKSHCDGDTEGFVKLLIDPATDRIRGATIVGTDASHLIHYAVVAMQHGLTAKQLARTITAHPTLPEAITEAAAQLYGASLVVASRQTAARPPGSSSTSAGTGGGGEVRPPRPWREASRGAGGASGGGLR